MITQATYFNSPEDETSLLGSILRHNELLDQYKITRDLFYEEAYRQIFDAILEIRARGSTADMIAVARQCPAYSVQIASCTQLLTADIKGLVQRLRDCIQARGAAAVVREISEMQAELKPSTEVVEEATKRIIKLTECREVSYRSINEVGVDAINEIAERRKLGTDHAGIVSGLEPLDKMTDGFQKGDYILLGARPSVGKTALALTLAMNAAAKGARIGFMSLEMKDTALFKRMLAASSGVSMQAIRTGLLGPRAQVDLVNGAAPLTAMKIYFADVPNMGLTDLISEARILRTREKIDMLIVDYIGLISVPNGEAPRWETFSMVSQRLKSLARELNIPVLALSQLGRQADGKRPGLADLRESGSLEQDADLIMFIHREEQTNDQRQEVKLIVAKQRNGETGDITLLFDRSRMKFYVPQSKEIQESLYKD